MEWGFSRRINTASLLSGLGNSSPLFLHSKLSLLCSSVCHSIIVFIQFKIFLLQFNRDTASHSQINQLASSPCHPSSPATRIAGPESYNASARQAAASATQSWLSRCCSLQRHEILKFPSFF
ncbi:uncharacterized protein LY89DRAFT_4701 [Mollisia scopiformis]|uniref:Uncharacterized protein n=1 Tax=Mollisia scopiformis TaxID=149040 RepID=A0A194XVX3_MOLSC|nr:uncharacterized protein LY89DRAFT_4701 [Mollisia scopiformis]KUJ23867.1 hypothetical protein LY89DRAFT_4701 [Mollisia scopiformis]